MMDLPPLIFRWPLLLVELDKLYPDKTNLVAVVAGCVETWCKSMIELLEDDSNEEWTDTLLERVKSWSRIRVFIEVSLMGDRLASRLRQIHTATTGIQE